MRRTALAVAALLIAAWMVAAPLGAFPTPWAKLHRPLHLPRVAPGAACPVSRVDPRIDWARTNIFGGSGIGRGPVYPGLGLTGGQLNATRDPSGGLWAGGKLFWYIRPSYRGRVLIRGHRLDGPQGLRFSVSGVAGRELRIEPLETVSWDGQPRGSRGLPSTVRILARGCYGVQIDGTTFSRIVVFAVTIS